MLSRLDPARQPNLGALDLSALHWKDVDALVSRATADWLSTRGEEPIAKLICRGKLARASVELQKNGARPDAAAIVRDCVGREGGGDPLSFPDRLPLAIAAVLSAERRAPSSSPGTCSALQEDLLRLVYAVDVRQLTTMRDSGLPTACASGEHGPAWWRAVQVRMSRPTMLEDLVFLDRFGIDWRQTDKKGVTLLGRTDYLAPLSHEALLYLVERTSPSGADLAGIALDVTRRRFTLTLGEQERAAIDTLVARVGEPTAVQIADSHYWIGRVRDDARLDRKAMAVFVASKLDPDGRELAHAIDGREPDWNAIEKVAKSKRSRQMP